MQMKRTLLESGPLGNHHNKSVTPIGTPKTPFGIRLGGGDNIRSEVTPPPWEGEKWGFLYDIVEIWCFIKGVLPPPQQAQGQVIPLLPPPPPSILP